MLRHALVVFCFVWTLAAAADSYDFPVVLPPFQDKAYKNGSDSGSCLFYLESLIVNVFAKKDSNPQAAGAVIGSRGDDNKPTVNKYNWKDEYATCIKDSQKPTGDTFTPQNFSFVLDVQVGDGGGVARSADKAKTYFTVQSPVQLKLNFATTLGYGWTLQSIELPQGLTVKSGGDSWLSTDLSVPANTVSNDSLAYMGMGTYGAYNWGCSRSKTIAFKVNDDYAVGIQFGNVQIQAFNRFVATGGDLEGQTRFGQLTSDCIGTFSAGSWMGIIVSLVLISVMMFGYLMLNSVGTVDRFDDPKQKQLVINAKE
ncbi:Vha-19 [Aphelenchoides fujianensis]|nr:Vha-19 [Aphelenchoides fujianensis]